MRPHGAGFVGSASGIHFVQSVYNAMSKPEPPTNLVPGEDDQLTNGGFETVLWRQHELASSDGQLLLQDILDWSQSYFDNWHPAFPLLHAPTIIEYFSKLCLGPLSTAVSRITNTQLAIVRSVLSISLADSRQSGLPIQLPPALVFHSYEEAIQSVQPVLINRPSIESLQAAMSVQLFLISMLRLNAASRIQGIIIRLILQMGLHRCPRRFSSFTQHEAAIRQRTFWSAFTVDRYLSQCLGLPLTLRDDDIDVCHLDHELHTSELDEDISMHFF